MVFSFNPIATNGRRERRPSKRKTMADYAIIFARSARREMDVIYSIDDKARIVDISAVVNRKDAY